MAAWLPDSFAAATPAGQLFGAVFLGVLLTRLFRHVLALLGLGS